MEHVPAPEEPKREPDSISTRLRGMRMQIYIAGALILAMASIEGVSLYNTHQKNVALEGKRKWWEEVKSQRASVGISAKKIGYTERIVVADSTIRYVSTIDAYVFGKGYSWDDVAPLEERITVLKNIAQMQKEEWKTGGKLARKAMPPPASYAATLERFARLPKGSLTKDK